MRNKRNETRHTSASRRLPISFSHLLSLCLLRGEILYRPRGSSSRNTSTGRDRQAAGGRGEGKGEGDRGRGVGEDRKCARLPRPHHDHDYDHAGNATMPRRRVCHLIAAARLRFSVSFIPPPTPSHMLILYFCPYIYNTPPSVRCSTNLFDSISWLTAPICLSPLLTCLSPPAPEELISRFSVTWHFLQERANRFFYRSMNIPANN